MKHKDKLKYTKLAYIHLIKLLIHQDSNQKIINKNLTYKEIIELINEYYTINNLQTPKISTQSISNLKNRKLKIKPIERNKYTENFVLFIKDKFNEFNIELFFSNTQDKIENKEIVLSPKVDIINKNRINNFYISWLIFGVIGIILLLYYNEEISKEYLICNNIKDIEPTIIEEYPKDYVDTSTDIQKEKKELTSKNWIISNKKYILTIVISLIIGFGLGWSLKYGLNNTINDNILITKEPWSLTPGSLNGRHGLLISLARNQNSNIDYVD